MISKCLNSSVIGMRLNVLWSRGIIGHLFEAQIEQGAYPEGLLAASQLPVSQAALARFE